MLQQPVWLSRLEDTTFFDGVLKDIEMYGFVEAVRLYRNPQFVKYTHTADFQDRVAPFVEKCGRDETAKLLRGSTFVKRLMTEEQALMQDWQYWKEQITSEPLTLFQCNAFCHKDGLGLRDLFTELQREYGLYVAVSLLSVQSFITVWSQGLHEKVLDILEKCIALSQELFPIFTESAFVLRIIHKSFSDFFLHTLEHFNFADVCGLFSSHLFCIAIISDKGNYDNIDLMKRVLEKLQFHSRIPLLVGLLQHCKQANIVKISGWNKILDCKDVTSIDKLFSSCQG